MPDKVRMVVAGAGAFGQEHLRTLAGMEDVELAGVADLNPAAAKCSAERYRVARWSSDALELIGSIRPDGLVVATPGHTHVALSSAALALGIAVLVEKPVALTVAEARELALAEAASTGFALPGHILRFSSAHRRFVELAQSGAVGPVLSVTARRHRDDSHASRYPDIDPVLMTMIHDIDLAMWITRAEAAQAFALRRPRENQRSETFLVAADSKGAVWRLATAWTFPGQAPPDRIEVIGEQGSVEMEVGAHIRQYGAVTRQIDLAVAPDDALHAELSYFVRCIRSPQPQGVVTLNDAIGGLRVAEAAMASLAAGTVVRL
jgi:predicted dehydrogenase